MKQAVITARGKVELKEVEEPQIIEADDVKIRVHYASICADDLIVFREDIPSNQIGHELSGVIVAVGEEARRNGFSVGDHVTGYSWLFCGKCPYCKRGRENLCVNLRTQGAMKEYIVLKDRQLCVLPRSIPLLHACISEVIAACIHGLERAGLKVGQSVVILGAGGVGLLMLQLAKYMGAVRITVSEPISTKRNLAKALGADHVINPRTANLSREAMAITDDMGFDLVIDASKNKEVVQQAINLMGRGGTLLLFSLYGSQELVSLNVANLYAKECTIVTSFMAPYMLERTIEVLPRLTIDKVIGRVYAFEEIQNGFEDFDSSLYPRVAIQITT